MIEPLVIYTHEGGSFVFSRAKGSGEVPLWDMTIKGTVTLNKQSLYSLLVGLKKALEEE